WFNNIDFPLFTTYNPFAPAFFLGFVQHRGYHIRKSISSKDLLGQGYIWPLHISQRHSPCASNILYNSLGRLASLIETVIFAFHQVDELIISGNRKIP